MGGTSTSSTFDLVQRFREGDESAFSELFRKYEPRLAVLIRYKLSDSLRNRIELDDILGKYSWKPLGTLKVHLPYARQLHELALKDCRPCPAGQTTAGWHTYHMIWSKDNVEYYINNPGKPYAAFTPSNISGFSAASWPFDTGPNFIILNLAVGGSWPGNPDNTTPLPSEMVVDCVRIYAN